MPGVSGGKTPHSIEVDAAPDNRADAEGGDMQVGPAAKCCR